MLKSFKHVRVGASPQKLTVKTLHIGCYSCNLGFPLREILKKGGLK